MAFSQSGDKVNIGNFSKKFKQKMILFQLAIGSSFMDESVVESGTFVPEPQIYLRKMDEVEIKPKNLSM